MTHIVFLITCLKPMKVLIFFRTTVDFFAFLNTHTIKFHREAVVVLEDLIPLSGMSESEKEIDKSTVSVMTTER